MPLAVIFFDFEPTVALLDRAVSLWSLMLVIAVVLGLAAATFLAARASDERHRLSPLDLWIVALGAVPGAVIGGRLGYVLMHLDFYVSTPATIFDVGQGAFQLSLAIVGGSISGAYVARVIDAPVGRWLHVATVPVFGAVLLGKVGMALGGAGQGSPSGAGWATAYLGDGPWGSLGPAIPSQPSQMYEAFLTFVVLLVLVGLVRAGALGRRDGLSFLVALEMWVVARFVVAFTWRDPSILGPLSADQLLSLGILAGCAAIHARIARTAPGERLFRRPASADRHIVPRVVVADEATRVAPPTATTPPQTPAPSTTPPPVTPAPPRTPPVTPPAAPAPPPASTPAPPPASTPAPPPPAPMSRPAAAPAPPPVTPPSAPAPRPATPSSVPPPRKAEPGQNEAPDWPDPSDRGPWRRFPGSRP